MARARETATFDLKKLGTFPIVHGARALALQHRIDELDTAARLRALAQRGVLAEEFSQDLIDSLRFMMVMKMQANLRQRAGDSPLENRVRLSDLSTLERGTLRSCQAVIRSFRRYMQMAEGVVEQRLVALFAGGCLLFNFPLLALWDRDVTVLGLPLFPLALFLIWALLIAALAWIVERSDDGGAPKASGPLAETTRDSLSRD
jgi:hypothetical protein